MYGFPACKKDPSAALGMTKRGNVFSHSFLLRCEPTSTPFVSPSFQRKEGDTRMPLSLYRHFERKREIFFVRGQEKWEESG